MLRTLRVIYEPSLYSRWNSNKYIKNDGLGLYVLFFFYFIWIANLFTRLLFNPSMYIVIYKEHIL